MKVMAWARWGLVAVLLGACAGGDREGARHEPTQQRPQALLQLTQKARLSPADPGYQRSFGWSVALSGDTALIGAITDHEKGDSAGAAYAFLHTSSGWTQQQKLLPNDPKDNTQFGYAVALDGDTAIVSPQYDGDDFEGAVYAFARSGSVWTQQQKLFASDIKPGQQFGFPVALAGDVLLVGAYDSTEPTLVRAVYAFERKGGLWSQQQKLLPPQQSEGTAFGYAMALRGDTALLSDSITDDSGFVAQVRVFVRSGGVWSLHQTIPSPGTASDSSFGSSLALDADTALIGAASEADQGAVYVYAHSGDAWTLQQKLTAPDPAFGRAFGCSVALSGAFALVGDFTDTKGDNTGAVYGFERADAGWQLLAEFTAPNPVFGAQFGYSVALDGNRALVGAFGESEKTDYDGAAYVLEVLTKTGDACAVSDECVSGHCTDGVCCDEACGEGADDCQVCSLALGAIADGSCTVLPNDTLCRASAGDCDVAEVCDGLAGICPFDKKKAKGTTCRVSLGVCDLEETCDGSAVDCPADALKAAGSECRASVGECDAAESCDGVAVGCPANEPAADGSECEGGACKAGACEPGGAGQSGSGGSAGSSGQGQGGSSGQGQGGASGAGQAGAGQGGADAGQGGAGAGQGGKSASSGGEGGNDAGGLGGSAGDSGQAGAGGDAGASGGSGQGGSAGTQQAGSGGEGGQGGSAGSAGGAGGAGSAGASGSAGSGGQAPAGQGGAGSGAHAGRSQGGASAAAGAAQAGAAGASAGKGGSGTSAPAASSDDDGGCGCRSAGAPSHTGAPLWMLTALAAWARCRLRSPRRSA